MDFVKEMLEERKVPDPKINNRGTNIKTVAQWEKRREEIKKLLVEEEYGKLPPKPEHLEVTAGKGIPNFCAGKVTNELLTFKATLDGKDFTFPVSATVPKTDRKVPAFIHINFRPDVPDRYQPTEEITDRGYAVFSFYYEDVAKDNDDFKSNCARYLSPSRRAKNSSGKIMMWAWAAMRVMDYLETLDYIDLDNVAVIGHSRLGKTALVTGAFDERFKYVISNDSGCSGAAISRGKIGETISRITCVFPFWFCPRYRENTDAEAKTFDQNYLLSLIAPRHLIVGSAELDEWADPRSEFLATASVNPIYELYGMKGLVYGEKVPSARCVLSAGDSSYHVRKGSHYLSREDWNVYMDFIDRIMKEAK